MKSIAIGLLAVLMFGAFLFVGSQQAQRQYEATTEQNKILRDNRGYILVLACEFAVPPAQRTAEHIEDCYNRVENIEKLKLQRW